MYRSLTEPYFRHCCPIWGSASSTNLQKLHKVQNRTARIVTDSPYDAHSKSLIKELGWLIKQLIDTETVKIVYKEAPKYRGGARNFPTEGLTPPTRGLKYGFQGTINAKNLQKNRLSPSDGGLTCSNGGTIAPSSPLLAPPLPKYLKELFHRLSDIQNRELRNSKKIFIFPSRRHPRDKKALPTWKYAFGTTSHVKQKQADRSPPLKQN